MADQTLLSIGTTVALASSGKHVEIIAGPNRKGEYQIAFGMVTMWIAASELRGVQEKKQPTKKHKKKVLKQSEQRSSISIDLHGNTVAEAHDILAAALDRAILSGASELIIVHGHGTGALRTAVYAFCKASRHIEAVKETQGNPGSCTAYL